MGGRQLQKSVGTLNNIKQRGDKSLRDFYTTSLQNRRGSICHYTWGNHSCLRQGTGPKGTILYDNLSVKVVNTVAEMAASLRSYIDLEIAKDDRKAIKDQRSKSMKRR